MNLSFRPSAKGCLFVAIDTQKTVAGHSQISFWVITNPTPTPIPGIEIYGPIATGDHLFDQLDSGKFDEILVEREDGSFIPVKFLKSLSKQQY